MNLKKFIFSIFYFFYSITSMAENNEILFENIVIPSSPIVKKILGEVEFPAVFLWRKSAVITKISYFNLLQFNNFESAGYQVSVIFPSDTLFFGINIGYVNVSSTFSSDLIAETPWRQAGLASHFYFEPNINLAIIEGYGKQLITILPNIQFVLSVEVKARFINYVSIFKEKKFSAIPSFLALSYDNDEINIIQQNEAFNSMLIESKKFFIGLGLNLDVYTANGLNFFSNYSFYPKFFKSLNNTLGSIIELNIGVGYAL